MRHPPALGSEARRGIRGADHLRAGDRIRLGGDVFRVAFVNFSRAHCIAERRELVAFSDPETGVRREFLATSRAIDISPTSLVERLR